MSANGLIEDRGWVQDQLQQEHSVTQLARLAGVSRQTASTWIRRHGLTPPVSSSHRPTPSRLRALYREHQTVAGVGEALEVPKATAHRWLAEAGVELANEGARAIPRPSDDQLRRLYAENGTQRAVAESLHVTLRTVQRWFADLDDSSPLADTTQHLDR